MVGRARSTGTLYRPEYENTRRVNKYQGSQRLARENDRVWTEEPPANNPAFVDNWFLRCQDLMDTYHPDLVYFDDYGLPLGQAGLDVTAHYYNANLQWNTNKLEAVVTAKQLSPEQSKGVVQDYERGFCDSIQAEPWQTCTCIGSWHYSREIAEKNSYKLSDKLSATLIDIVSKNGNLLLSIPIRGDGTIDQHEIAFLEVSRNGWRQWRSSVRDATMEMYGEGPTKLKAGMFNENAASSFYSGRRSVHNERQDTFCIPAGMAGREESRHQVAGTRFSES